METILPEVTEIRNDEGLTVGEVVDFLLTLPRELPVGNWKYLFLQLRTVGLSNLNPDDNKGEGPQGVVF